MLRRYLAKPVGRVFKSAMAEAMFPKSLREFGYAFDADGRLRKLDSSGEITEEGFEFNVSSDPNYNQKRYEALGEVVNEYVYDLLEQKGLKRLPVPKESSASTSSRSFIFGSTDVLASEKLMILIHGSGVVRAGQWARRLIINDSLSTGTQIPYIEKARGLGYGVLVLNTNDNYRTVQDKTCKIKGSGDPHEHLETVWRDYVEPSNSKRIAVVAHSYGGECTVKFAMKHAEAFEKRVFAVALTDSVHIAPRTGLGYLGKIARNWVCSKKPLDTPLTPSAEDIERVSAGHTVHEMSSASCMDSVFDFLEERIRRFEETPDTKSDC